MSGSQRGFFKNLSSATFSNGLTLLVSAFSVFFVPKFIGQEDFGYWQFYVFLTAYSYVPALGWNDGVYLRYGGEEYDKLDKRVFSGQFKLLMLFELFLYLVFFICLPFFSPADKLTLLICAGSCMLIMAPRYFLVFTLQATNRITGFSAVLVLEKILYAALLAGVLLYGYRGFVPLLVADLIAKGVSLLYAMYLCRDFVFRRGGPGRGDLAEAKENISAGFKLTLSGMASMLIIGVVRFAIENKWDIATFGKVSLSLSFSNYLMMFISAMGIVLFPMLRRAQKERLSEFYSPMCRFITTLLFTLMLLYYPGSMLLAAWLPKYSDSLVYMSMIFPLCIFESKYVMITNTYLKTLRREKSLALINISSVALSLGSTFVLVFVLGSLQATVLSILLLLIFRGIVSDIVLSRHMPVKVSGDIIWQLLLTATFLPPLAGMGAYAAALAVFYALNLRDIRGLVPFVRAMAKK